MMIIVTSLLLLGSMQAGATAFPPPRQFGWILKPLSSAESISATQLETGQNEFRIKHGLIKGVSTEMLYWFNQNFLDLEFIINGTVVSAFHCWHPFDHILLERKSGKAGDVLKNGDMLRLKEAFGRDIKYVVDDIAAVCDFGEKSFGVRVDLGLATLGRLVHRFENVPGGTQCNTHFVIGLGPTSPSLLKLFVNNVVLPSKFGPAMQTRWLKHNVEEYGCLENFLPKAYSRRADGMRINLDD